MKGLKARPSPAMLVAIAALVFAMTGGAYAAIDLVGKSDIKSKHVKDLSLQGKDLANDTVTGVQVNESTLTLPSSATPSGAAGGDLTGTYPNPLIGNDKVTAAKMADNAISSPEVAPDSLTAADLAPDSVDSSEIAANAVNAAEIAADAVGTSEIATNGVGTTEIAASAVGAEELKAVTTVQQTTNLAGGAGNVASLQVNCPAGTQVVSGGGFPTLATTDMVSNIVNGNGWFVAIQGNAAGADVLTVRAFCLAV